MFRLSPRRNQRSKGFKGKHALQLSLLLGISWIWMLYQLKHSQDKKTTLGEASVSVQNVFKLGRKYLHPQKDETSIVDARLEEDEETKNEVLNRPDDMNDSNAGKGVEADDILAREHEQDKDKDTVDQEKEAQVRDERADPVKENEQEDNVDNVNILVDGESKEDEKRVSGKIEVNESERAQDIENVSRVKRSKESQESVRHQGKENENENENAHIKETDKEDEENVEKVQDGGEANDGAEGSQEQEQNREKEEEERKMEDLITSNDHVQDGSDRKDEEAKQEYKTIDNSSIVVLNQIQHVPDGNSTVNITNNTEVVDDARNKNGANVEDGSKNEEKTMDASQTSRVNESHYRLQEKDNSITVSEGTSNPSVQDGTEYNTVQKQDETKEHRNSGGDNNNLQNIVVNQTLESALAASSEQSDSGSTSGATDADTATSGEFKDTTTHPELHDNSTQSYSAMKGNSESSDGEKSNNNPTAEGTQESIVLSDTNGNVHDEKDEQVTSSYTSLESEREWLSTSDNNSNAEQSESDKLVQKNGTDNKSTKDNHEAGETGRR